MAGPADQEKLAALADLAAARKRLSASGEELRRSLDVTSRAKESFRRHRPTWLSVAAIAGLVLSKLPARSKTVFVERATGRALGAAGKLGAVWTVARLAFDVARPFLGELTTKSVGEFAKRFTESRKQPPSSPPDRQ